MKKKYVKRNPSKIGIRRHLIENLDNKEWEQTLEDYRKDLNTHEDEDVLNRDHDENET